MVDTAWLTASLALSGGRLAPEEPYEVAGDGSSGGSNAGAGGGGCSGSNGTKAANAPAKGRQYKAEGRPPLLSGWQVFCLGSGALKESCSSLVKAAGGAVVARLPPVAASPPGSGSQQQQQQLGDADGGGGGGGGGEHMHQLLVLMPEGGGGAGGAMSSGSQKGQLAHAQALGVPVLGQKWLMDCVSHMELLPMDGYRMV